MSAIKVGDLVMVVRTTCCGFNLGIVFAVKEIISGATWRCAKCHAQSTEKLALDGWGERASSGYLSTLKRLDPDALKDDVPTGEELTA